MGLPPLSLLLSLLFVGDEESKVSYLENPSISQRAAFGDADSIKKVSPSKLERFNAVFNLYS
jgi:hypothetical protein